MFRFRIYIDTSVIGGCCDVEFQEWSKKLLAEFKNGNYIAVISDITLVELEEAPGRSWMKTEKKDFDAVKMMRDIREKLRKQYEDNPGLREKRLYEIHEKYGLKITEEPMPGSREVRKMRS